MLRRQLNRPISFFRLDLRDQDKLANLIQDADVVVHCAGPFHDRDATVLQLCLKQHAAYVDVSDHAGYTRQMLTYRERAQAEGVTALINTGVFPGISNSMARQAIAALDCSDKIQLSYVVGGSGGAGLTVMRTTFLALQQPFTAWIDGQWQLVQPYGGREVIEFPPPFGAVDVYWFELPELVTLSATFPVRTVVTKFGSVPPLYNHLSSLVARLPSPILRHPLAMEVLAQVSYRMARLSDPWTGIGVAVRADVSGIKDGQPHRSCATFVHPQTVAAVGAGTGMVVQLILEGQLHRPGVWSPEQVLSPSVVEQALQQRGLRISHSLQPQPTESR
jgi:saccharopine dehydrogenase-like NADP-dependent oxidoreductase